jgi:hypothetical protein
MSSDASRTPGKMEMPLSEMEKQWEGLSYEKKRKELSLGQVKFAMAVRYPSGNDK